MTALIYEDFTLKLRKLIMKLYKKKSLELKSYILENHLIFEETKVYKKR